MPLDESRTTVQHVAHAEDAAEEAIKLKEERDWGIAARLKDDNFWLALPRFTCVDDNRVPFDLPDFEHQDPDPFDRDNPQDPQDIEMVEPHNLFDRDDFVVETDDGDKDMCDGCVGAEVNLEIGDQVVQGKVTKRTRDTDGDPIGTCHEIPSFDTQSYEVELDDGAVAQHAADIVAENLFSQIISEGKQHLFVDQWHHRS